MTKSTKSSTSTEPVFIDTSGFYALVQKDDPHHASAREFMEEARRSLLRFTTTDYVLDETATLLKARKFGHLIEPFFQLTESSESLNVAYIDEEYFLETKRFFLKHADQNFSFTDCSSFVIMRSMQLERVLTADEHFRIVGFQPLLA